MKTTKEILIEKMNQSDSIFFTKKEAAELLGIKEITLKVLKDLKRTYLGSGKRSTVFFTREHLIEFVESKL